MIFEKEVSVMLKWVFGVIGFVLGGPISYFFQSALIREKVPFGEYAIKSLSIMIEPEAWENAPFIGNVGLTILVTCLVCAAIAYFIGRSMEKSGKA